MTLASASAASRVTAISRLTALRVPPTVALSFAVIALVIAWSLAPGLFTNHSPIIGIPADKLLGPGAEHWFGTDHLRRDLSTRVVYGTASSVTSALIAVVIAAVAGGLIGLLAGFFGGWVDIVLARLVDVLLAIPNFLLAVIVVTAIGFDTTNAAIATAISAVAVFARVMRSEVIQPRQATSRHAPFRVDGLSVSYGPDEVVSDVGFELGRGQSLALIGESGSGKSTIARAVLRLLPSGGHATGRIAFDGQEVLGLSERRFRPLRGRAIGFVPQDPGNSLNPVRTIGVQAKEAAALLDKPDKAIRKQLILETFAQVGLDNPQRVYDSYPHQLSGGMLQRVLIGLAILPRPALLVADEPTSALDVTIQKRILDLLTRLQHDLKISLLLITHDLAIAAERANALVVLKDGVIQEAGQTASVFSAPASAYARKLHADVPALNPDRYAALRDPGFRRLKTGAGEAPKIE